MSQDNYNLEGYTIVRNETSFQIALIKNLARRGKFDRWYEVWQIFEEIAETQYIRRLTSAASIGMSMLTVANGPPSSILGKPPPDIWNEED